MDERVRGSAGGRKATKGETTSPRVPAQVARRHTPEGAAYFACQYCGEERCEDRAGCRESFERQVRSDAAYGAAARRRRWIEGNVLPSAERALRSGPAGAGALMLGAFTVGTVGAILGGVASSVAEVTTGGVEVLAGIGDAVSSAATPVLSGGPCQGADTTDWTQTLTGAAAAESGRSAPRRGTARRRAAGTAPETAADASFSFAAPRGRGADDLPPLPALPPRGDAATGGARTLSTGGAAAVPPPDAPPRPSPAFPNGQQPRASCSRGCIKIASGAVLVPVATVTIAALFAIGAAAGSVTLAAGIVKEVISGSVDAASITINAINDATGNHPALVDAPPQPQPEPVPPQNDAGATPGGRGEAEAAAAAAA